MGQHYQQIAFTVVFVLLGSILVYSGTTTLVTIDQYPVLLLPNHGQLRTTAVVLLVTSLAIFLVAIGAGVAVTRNWTYLYAFFVILTLLLIVELITASFQFAFKRTILTTTNIQNAFTQAIVRFNSTDTNSTITQTLNEIQMRLGCCGGRSAADWIHNEFYQNGTLPDSCCWNELANHNNNSNNRTECLLDRHLVYRSCVDVIEATLVTAVGHLAGLGLVLVAIQMIGLLLGHTLYDSQRPRYTYEPFTF